MNRFSKVTNINHAKGIINAVGGEYQTILKQIAPVNERINNQRILSVANNLWENNFDEIPEDLKNFNE